MERSIGGQREVDSENGLKGQFHEILDISFISSNHF